MTRVASRASALGWLQRLKRVISIDIERCGAITAPARAPPVSAWLID